MNREDIVRLLEDDIAVLHRNAISKSALQNVREDLRRILKQLLELWEGKKP